MAEWKRVKWSEASQVVDTLAWFKLDPAVRRAAPKEVFDGLVAKGRLHDAAHFVAQARLLCATKRDIGRQIQVFVHPHLPGVDLERDFPFQGQLPGEVDLPHPTLAELPEEVEISERTPRKVCGGVGDRGNRVGHRRWTRGTRMARG